MTTKILTVRVPSPLYATLCRGPGELGVPVAAHIQHSTLRRRPRGPVPDAMNVAL